LPPHTLRTPRSTLFPYTTLFRSVRATVRALELCRPWVSDLLHLVPARDGRDQGRRGREVRGRSDGHLHDHEGPDAIRWAPNFSRSEEHTSELQSRGHLVCRLLLE